jgi:hypothetical protein
MLVGAARASGQPVSALRIVPMSRGLPQVVKDNVEKCRSSAIAAVDAYNRPGPRFRTAQYVILIVIAWSALLHAIFYRKGRRPWYRKSVPGQGIRYVKIDGEPKHWDLTECLKQYFADKLPPERKNLEFLIGLRNKIEHRYLPEFDASLYGECQAALMNLEEILVQEFGTKYALTDQLAVSLQFSRVVPEEKQKATKKLVATTARTVKEYIEKFRGGLAGPVLNSMKYSYTVFLVPRVANRANAADAAVQFLKIDETNPDEVKRLENLNVLIREKQIPISNLGLLKAGEVVAEVKKRAKVEINQNIHTRAWKYYKVRPPANESHPERTRPEYCVYDETHEDYVYTNAWVEKLAHDLADAAEFQRVVGRAPRPGG